MATNVHNNKSNPYEAYKKALAQQKSSNIKMFGVYVKGAAVQALLGGKDSGDSMNNVNNLMNNISEIQLKEAKVQSQQAQMQREDAKGYLNKEVTYNGDGRTNKYQPEGCKFTFNILDPETNLVNASNIIATILVREKNPKIDKYSKIVHKEKIENVKIGQNTFKYTGQNNISKFPPIIDNEYYITVDLDYLDENNEAVHLEDIQDYASEVLSIVDGDRLKLKNGMVIDVKDVKDAANIESQKVQEQAALYGWSEVLGKEVEVKYKKPDGNITLGKGLVVSAAKSNGKVIDMVEIKNKNNELIKCSLKDIVKIYSESIAPNTSENIANEFLMGSYYNQKNITINHDHEFNTTINNLNEGPDGKAFYFSDLAISGWYNQAKLEIYNSNGDLIETISKDAKDLIVDFRTNIPLEALDSTSQNKISKNIENLIDYRYIEAQRYIRDKLSSGEFTFSEIDFANNYTGYIEMSWLDDGSQVKVGSEIANLKNNKPDEVKNTIDYKHPAVQLYIVEGLKEGDLKLDIKNFVTDYKEVISKNWVNQANMQDVNNKVTEIGKQASQLPEIQKLIKQGLGTGELKIPQFKWQGQRRNGNPVYDKYSYKLIIETDSGPVDYEIVYQVQGYNISNNKLELNIYSPNTDTFIKNFQVDKINSISV